MRIKRGIVVAVAATAAAVLPASSAFAIDCTNTSRPALNTAKTAPTYEFGPVQIWIVGNWAWVVVPDEGGFWTFIPPGTGEAALLAEMGLPVSAPGANGNYTNGRHDDLLGQSQALCSPGRVAQLESGNVHGIVAEPQCTPR